MNRAAGPTLEGSACSFILPMHSVYLRLPPHTDEDFVYGSGSHHCIDAPNVLNVFSFSKVTVLLRGLNTLSPAPALVCACVFECVHPRTHTNTHTHTFGPGEVPCLLRMRAGAAISPWWRSPVALYLPLHGLFPSCYICVATYRRPIHGMVQLR